MIDPLALMERKVPVNKLVQWEGEFIITFPGAYHAGFNSGLNIAEAVNFADQNWIEHGYRASILNKDRHLAPTIPFTEIIVKAVKDGHTRVSSPLYKVCRTYLSATLTFTVPFVGFLQNLWSRNREPTKFSEEIFKSRDEKVVF